MSVKIALRSKAGWNEKRLTFVEEPSAMGDAVMVCIHGDGDDPECGTTVKVYRYDLIRAARMLALPFEGDELVGIKDND